jgi:hypothetical protein
MWTVWHLLNIKNRTPEMCAGELFGMCDKPVHKIVPHGHKFRGKSEAREG